MEHQEVAVTIPASFDEVARRLTVEAADMAGLHSVLLLEEPLAACYDWHMRHAEDAARILDGTRLLLVCDVGGGTTDLSLISVQIIDGRLRLNRIGVGDHLMLGGDNIDLALAYLAEQRIVQSRDRLGAGAFSQLVQQTRQAKEVLLAQDPPDRAKVTVLGSGSRLVAGARSCELSREEVSDLVLDGFFLGWGSMSGRRIVVARSLNLGCPTRLTRRSVDMWRHSWIGMRRFPGRRLGSRRETPSRWFRTLSCSMAGFLAVRPSRSGSINCLANGPAAH